MPEHQQIEPLVRARLRALRQRAGWSLDELASRSHVGASTISRIETGKRTISLDVLVPLAGALQVDLDEVLSVATHGDVVIRPVPSTTGDRTTWLLSRPTGTTHAVKIRLEPSERSAEQQVHPGHDWFYVLSGRVRLRLGDREILVAAGEAAEFETMTPHALEAHGEPAEVVMIFDRDGQLAHARTDDEVDPAPDR